MICIDISAGNNNRIYCGIKSIEDFTLWTFMWQIEIGLHDFKMWWKTWWISQNIQRLLISDTGQKFQDEKLDELSEISVQKKVLDMHCTLPMRHWKRSKSTVVWTCPVLAVSGWSMNFEQKVSKSVLSLPNLNPGSETNVLCTKKTVFLWGFRKTCWSFKVFIHQDGINE